MQAPAPRLRCGVLAGGSEDTAVDHRRGSRDLLLPERTAAVDHEPEEPVEESQDRVGRRRRIVDLRIAASAYPFDVRAQRGARRFAALAPHERNLLVLYGEREPCAQKAGTFDRGAEDLFDAGAQPGAFLLFRPERFAQRRPDALRALAVAMQRRTERIALIAEVAVKGPVRETGFGADRRGGYVCVLASFEQALERIEQSAARLRPL